MLRALVALIGVMLVAGVYALVTGGTSTHAAAPQNPSSSHFGFALAAGAVALAATLLLSRPRFRFRR